MSQNSFGRLIGLIFGRYFTKNNQKRNSILEEEEEEKSNDSYKMTVLQAENLTQTILPTEMKQRVEASLRFYKTSEKDDSDSDVSKHDNSFFSLQPRNIEEEEDDNQSEGRKSVVSHVPQSNIVDRRNTKSKQAYGIANLLKLSAPIKRNNSQRIKTIIMESIPVYIYSIVPIFMDSITMSFLGHYVDATTLNGVGNTSFNKTNS